MQATRENGTPKLKQNPETWGGDHFWCILVNQIISHWANHTFGNHQYIKKCIKMNKHTSEEKSIDSKVVSPPQLCVHG